MKPPITKNGFSLVELMMVVALFSIISTAGFILFSEGQALSSVTTTKINLQNNIRQLSQRLIYELQESGEDQNNVLQVSISDNAGPNNTDILSFSVPICPCGTLPIDQNGDVTYWGAPLVWGQSGCNAPYTAGGNGKVDICHLPPGNPNNPQDLQVDPSSIQAHLAHGDWIGDCAACVPNNFTNKTIEYRVDAAGQLLRRVLDVNGVVLASAVMALNVGDFQAGFGAGQDSVNITIQLERLALENRTISVSTNLWVVLRNKD